MAFNWLLKQHRSEAARIKNQFLLSTQLWPFNLFSSRNRWLKNKKKTFLFIQYAFELRCLHFFLFSILFVVFIYIVWSYLIETSAVEKLWAWRERESRGEYYILSFNSSYFAFFFLWSNNYSMNFDTSFFFF